MLHFFVIAFGRSYLWQAIGEKSSKRIEKNDIKIQNIVKNGFKS